jgi:hypothetical protein
MKDGERSGYGVLKNEEGKQVYVGNWKNDKYHFWGCLNNFNPVQ